MVSSDEVEREFTGLRESKIICISNNRKVFIFNLSLLLVVVEMSQKFNIEEDITLHITKIFGWWYIDGHI